jgi:hypothetical protein
MENKTLTSVDDLLGYISDINEHRERKLDITVSFDDISIKPKGEHEYILNAYAYEDNSPDVGHWVVLRTDGTEALLYTCLGVITPGLIEHLVDNGFRHILLDLRSHQKITSKSCGFYCVRYLIEEEWRNIKEGTYLSYKPGKYSNIDLTLRNTDIFMSNLNEDGEEDEYDE